MSKFLGAVLLAAISLAACGGGGSTPGPLPSTTPKTVYSSQIRFVGPLAGAQVQSDLRRVESLSPMTSGAPIPVMVVQPPEADIDSSVYGGDVQVVVSPEPTSSPTVSVTQTNADAAILATPSPSAGQTPVALPTGVIADVQIKGKNAVQSQSAGTATATIGSPVNETPTTPVYSYMSVALDCSPGPGGVAGGSSTPYTNHFGWKWDGSTWVADDDVSTADIYIDGPGCMAPNSSESEPTIHVPGGDTRLSTDTPFNSVSASQWTNSETSFQAIAANGMINPDGSVQALVIGKTLDGSHIFKIFPNAFGDGMFGAIEISGDSVDGF